MRVKRYVAAKNAIGWTKLCLSPAPQFGPLWLEAPPTGWSVTYVWVGESRRKIKNLEPLNVARSNDKNSWNKAH